jgi:excisionase family DNA binding protein
MDKLLDVHSVADTLALSPLTVRRYIARGRLKAIRLGRRVLVEPSELERFVAAAKVEHKNPPSLR